MAQVELSVEQVKILGWDDAEKYTHIKQAVHDRSAASRVVRPTLPLFGDQTLDPNSIPLYTFDPILLQIDSSAHVRSVRLSREFVIESDGFGQEAIGAFSAERAAEKIAAAEDALLLLGAAAGARLKTLGVKIDEGADVYNSILKSQQGLFDEQRGLIEGDSLYNVVVAGMKVLQEEYPNATYCVIVSPDLWAEAVALRDSNGTTLRSIIEELLRPSGSRWGAATASSNGAANDTQSSDNRLFRSSRALDGQTGVIFVCRQDGSMLNFGGVIDIAVPSEAFVAYVSQNNSITLRIEERVKLRLNDPKAVVSFRAKEARAGGP